jgi:hypothetical protein
LFYFDDDNKRVQLALDASKIIALYNEQKVTDDLDVTLLPEFGNWMVEAVPGKPYGNYSDPNELLSCEAKLIKR